MRAIKANGSDRIGASLGVSLPPCCRYLLGQSGDAVCPLAFVETRRSMVEPPSHFTSLAGQLLVAMPSMPDKRFARTVIFLCAHTEEAAMGLVLNRLHTGVDFPSLLTQLEIDATAANPNYPVHIGGPVEQGRGFILHTTDMVREESMLVSDEIALTGSLDMLRDIARESGPQRSLFALGYAGWGPGQLDSEIQANGWLHAPARMDILFTDTPATSWERALDSIGVSPASLSGFAGHA